MSELALRLTDMTEDLNATLYVASVILTLLVMASATAWAFFDELEASKILRMLKHFVISLAACAGVVWISAIVRSC